MLRRNFHQRPSAVDLTKLAYVQGCLELSKSSLVKRDALVMQDNSAVKPTTTKRVPSKLVDIPGTYFVLSQVW
jgi:probable inactive protein kinase-like protein SgK071